MKRLKLMFRGIYSLDAIYELRKTPILITLMVGIVLGIAHMSPFALQFFREETYRWDQSMWGLDTSDEERLMAGLPDDCIIEGGQLSCTDFYEIVVNEEVVVQFNGRAEDIVNGLVFLEDHVVLVQQGRLYPLSYQSFEGMNFGELRGATDGYEQIFTAMARELRPLVIVQFTLGVYQTGLISYFVFVFMVAAISMLLKFSHAQFVTFKEMFNLIVYSSVLPVVILIIVGVVFNPGFTTVIFNTGTPLVAYGVYRKKIAARVCEEK